MKWGIIGNGNVVQTKSGGAFKDKVIFNRCGPLGWFMENVDAVYIATPPSSHLHYARIAAKHGKPTLVEKPMALNALEAAIMADEFHRAGVPLFVAYYRRCLPRFQKVKEILESGAIGDVRFTHITHTMKPQDHPVAPVIKGEPLPWRYKKEINGGGNFVDMGTHHLDLLDYFFGPIEYWGGGATNEGGLYEVEDSVSMVGLAGGVAITGQWCYAAEINRDVFYIVGSEGELEFEVFTGTSVLLRNNEEIVLTDYPNPEWVHAPLIKAIEEELNGGEKCPTNWENGLRAMTIQDKILNG